MIRAALLTVLLIASSALAADIAGEHTGTYSSNSGSEGTVRTVIKKSADSTWDCKFYFNSGGDEVQTKTISCSIGANKMTGEYEATVDGDALKISMEGAIAEDNSMTGSYKAIGANGEVVDTGTWKTSPHP